MNRKILIVFITLVAFVFLIGILFSNEGLYFISPKDELLKLLAIPAEKNYNASYSFSAGGSGAYTNIQSYISVQNETVMYYKYTSNNRATNTLKEYSSDKGWLNCKDAPGAGPTTRTETIYLNCSDDYKTMTEDYIKNKFFSEVSSTQNVTFFFNTNGNSCFHLKNLNSYGNYNICFDRDKRLVSWDIPYDRGSQRWTKNLTKR